jgi:hypothetical protein
MKKLLIILLFFGFSFSQDLYLRGDGYKGEFLGCLTCNKYDSESICNKYGTYGSKYSSESIWNKYGTYGSKYSSESPWNKYSTNGPKIYNKEGEYYGRYTINIYDSDSSELSRNLKKLYEMFDGDLEKIRNTLCD